MRRFSEQEKHDLACCHSFRQAMEPGTDGEAYGSLIRGWAGQWNAGCNVPAIKFCPWCGKVVPEIAKDRST